MLIGELSKRTGFSHDTIRFYERKGLIAVNKKERRENNYKEYAESVCERLLLIRDIKKLGFTLSEVDDFIRGWSEEGVACHDLVNHLTDKIARVEEQIALLTGIKSKLNSSLTRCLADDCEFEKTMPRRVKSAE